jgi:hypothetical protein
MTKFKYRCNIKVGLTYGPAEIWLWLEHNIGKIGKDCQYIGYGQYGFSRKKDMAAFVLIWGLQ